MLLKTTWHLHAGTADGGTKMLEGGGAGLLASTRCIWLGVGPLAGSGRSCGRSRNCWNGSCWSCSGSACNSRDESMQRMVGATAAVLPCGGLAAAEVSASAAAMKLIDGMG